MLSRMIMRICNSKWSHTGIGFNLLGSDGILRKVYFEAMVGRVVGPPRPLEKLLEHSQKPGCGHELTVVNCPVDVARRKYLVARSYIGAVSYAELQLLAMLLHIRVGWHVPSSPGRMVCSELVGRILFPEFDLRKRGESFDEITPEDVRKWTLLHRIGAGTPIC